MGTDRTWTIRKDAPSSPMPFDSFQASILGPNTDNVSVVEEARLREAEAELHRAQEIQADEYKQRVGAVARAERLEAELREAAASFNELAIYLHPLPEGGHARLGEACGVDACILCLAETRAKEARDRARGVLEKGDKS